jgi:hypothetical protein
VRGPHAHTAAASAASSTKVAGQRQEDNAEALRSKPRSDDTSQYQIAAVGSPRTLVVRRRMVGATRRAA